MAEYGADVIKIEAPTGDAYRQVSALPGMPQAEIEYGALMDNRNKRGLAIDLTTDAGRDVVHRLVADADVFVTNLPLQTREKLAVDHATLSALNSRLIYGSFTAFGEFGEEATKPGFDSTAYWARSGLMDQVRVSAADEPAKSVSGQGDHPSAMALYAAIVSALYQRERTGQGALVRSSLLANGLWANGYYATAALNGARFVPRPPRRQSLNALTAPYQCADDRWLALGILNEDRHWPTLRACLGLDELVADPRFAAKKYRQENSTALFEQVQAVFEQHDRDHWQRSLSAAGIVFEVIATPEDIAHDEQARVNGFTLPFPDAPDLRAVSTPFSMDFAEKAPLRLPPSVGEHTDAVLAEAGYGPSEIATLRADGVIP
ncbi:MAG: CaiB/BaiF CoA transferase family protein [Cumulibacter sp.]